MKHILPAALRRLAAGLLGQFHWSPPPWLRGVASGSGRLLRRHRVALSVSVVLAGAGLWGGVKWHQWGEAHRPRPDLVRNVLRDLTPSAHPPGPPSWSRTGNRWVPDVLRIVFNGVAEPLMTADVPPETSAGDGGALPPAATARPGAVSGLTLSPEHPGHWQWASESSLIFMPEAPWPPGRKFTVKLEDTLPLATTARLTERRLEFTAAPLRATVGGMEFHMDPRDPAVQQVTGKITLTHPVMQEDLERHLTLSVLGGTPLFATGGPAFTVQPQAQDPLTFHVRSPQVIIPAKEDFAVLTVMPGLRGSDGGEPLAVPASAKLVVRDKFSRFSITEITAGIVPDPEGVPVQHLFLSTEGITRPETLESWLEVRRLPARPQPEDEDEEEDDAGSTGREKVEGYGTPGMVPAEVLARAEPVKLAYVPAPDPLTARHTWRLPPMPPGQLWVRVRAGLPAAGGYELKEDFTTLTAIPDFPKEVEFTARGGLLSLSGGRKLEVKSRGVSHLRYTVARIPAGSLNHLAAMTGGRFESPFWRGYAFDEKNLGRFHREVVPVAKLNDWDPVWSTFDPTGFPEAAEPSDPDPSRGLFFITVEAVKPRKPWKAEGTDEAGGHGAPAGDETWGNGGGERSSGPDGQEDGPEAEWEPVEVSRHPLPPFGTQNGTSRSNTGGRCGPSRFVLVTDLGLLVKENANGTRDVFVQSLREGGPVSAVELRILARNGGTLASATTDEEGHAVLPETGAMTGEHQPVVLVARSSAGNDVSFLPLNRQDRKLDFSRFETGGVVSGGADRLDAFVFTERGVYRPGDTVHSGLIVRRRDGAPAPEGLPVTVQIRNPAGRLVFSTTRPLPAGGLLDVRGTLSATGPTGQHLLEAVLFPDKPDPVSIGRTPFRVEDFEPDRMKLLAELPGVPSSGWTLDAGIVARLDLQTLFGFPAAGRRITGRLDLAPADFAFADWPGYIFHDRAPANLTAGRERNLGETTTGADGRAAFDLGLRGLADVSVAFTFTAEAFEPDSGRSVAVRRRGLFSPFPSVLGWKADGSLDGIARHAPRNLRLVSLGADLKPVPSPGLTRVLSIRQRQSVLIRRDNGSYAYESATQLREISRGPLEVPAEGLTLPLPVDSAGDFELEFLHPGGARAGFCTYSVTGPGTGHGPGGQGSLEQNAELTMRLARRDWKSGEELELHLAAPFTGAGLLTIEREKVLGWRWFKSGDPRCVQTIRVPEGLEGTAYVQAAFVRAPDSPEVLMSPLSYAVEPFRANPDRGLIPLTLEAPAQARPGAVLPIRLSSPRPVHAVVYAVDEGIHQITDYALPRPHDFFLRPRALEVDTVQILDLLIPEFPAAGRMRAFGGDGGDDGPGVNLNPFQRKREAPVVFWSGLLSTGPEGIEVDCPVPDYFAGGLSLMAVAVGPDQGDGQGAGCGSASARTVVRGPFVLTPNAPLFATPGDTCTLSLTIANNVENGGGAASIVHATLAATPNIKILSAPDTLTIHPGTEGTARFEVEVQEPLGNATLTFRTDGGGQSSSRTVTLSVRPPTPRLTTVRSGWFRQPVLELMPERRLYPDFATRSASVSPLPLSLARGLSGWLAEFPHECTEQLISRAMPHLLLSSAGVSGTGRTRAERELARVFAILPARQTPQGSFGTWSAREPEADGFLTVYAAEFLTTAQEAGFAVPEDLRRRTLKALRVMASATGTPAGGLTLQARAIHTLTRNGEVTTNWLLNLRDSLEKEGTAWREGPAALWIAGTHALLRQDDGAAEILKIWLAAKKPAVRPWNFWQDQPLALDALDLMLLARHFPETAGRLGYDSLQPVLKGLQRNEFNTYSAACCVQALHAWSTLQKDAGIRTSLTEITPSAPPRLLAPPASGVLQADFTEAASGIRFGLLRPDGAPDTGAFYQIVESGFDRAVPAVEIRQGLEIARRLSRNGKPVSQVLAAEEVTVELAVRNLGNDPLTDLAITDLLPGGWEVEEGIRPGPRGAPGCDSVDMREDRNVFYCGIGAGQTLRIIYRMRPLCAGTFTVPPPSVSSLYRPAVQARGLARPIRVLPRP